MAKIVVTNLTSNEIYLADFYVSLPGLATKTFSRPSSSINTLTNLENYKNAGTVSVSIVEELSDSVLGIDDAIVYVDAGAGNDLNDGTSTAPVKTIVAALKLVPIYRRKGRIKLVGTTTHVIPDNTVLRLPYGEGVNSEPFAIEGGFTDSGLGTLTITSSTWDVNGVYSITAAIAPATDAYQGYYVRFTSGPLNGYRFAIQTNSNVGVFRLAVSDYDGPASPGGGATFVIESPSQTITHGNLSITGSAVGREPNFVVYGVKFVGNILDNTYGKSVNVSNVNMLMIGTWITSTVDYVIWTFSGGVVHCGFGRQTFPILTPEMDLQQKQRSAMPYFTGTSSGTFQRLTFWFKEGNRIRGGGWVSKVTRISLFDAHASINTLYHDNVSFLIGEIIYSNYAGTTGFEFSSIGLDDSSETIITNGSSSDAGIVVVGGTFLAPKYMTIGPTANSRYGIYADKGAKVYLGNRFFNSGTAIIKFTDCKAGAINIIGGSSLLDCAGCVNGSVANGGYGITVDQMSRAFVKRTANATSVTGTTGEILIDGVAKLYTDLDGAGFLQGVGDTLTRIERG